MKNTFYESAAGIAIALALFVGGMAFGSVLNRFSTDPGDAATWAGAIFAGFAFTGAIYLAQMDNASRRKERAMHARLLIPGIVMKLIQMRPIVILCLRILQEQKVRSPDVFKYLSSEFSSVRMWDVNDVLPLVDIQGDCASQLMLIREIYTIVMHFFKDPPEQPAALTLQTIDQLRRMLHLIELSIKNCQAQYDKNIHANV